MGLNKNKNNKNTVSRFDEYKKTKTNMNDGESRSQIKHRRTVGGIKY